jgi:hypothetical protein
LTIVAVGGQGDAVGEQSFGRRQGTARGRFVVGFLGIIGAQ